MTGDEKAKLAGVVAPPRGDRAEFVADVEREGCGGEPARNSRQTGKRRGIGWRGSRITLGSLEVRKRSASESSCLGILD